MKTVQVLIRVPILQFVQFNLIDQKSQYPTQAETIIQGNVLAHPKLLDQYIVDIAGVHNAILSQE
jgi:hypothetical protein